MPDLSVYFFVLLLLASSAYAFGSGNIAADANLGGKAFRHGGQLFQIFRESTLILDA